MLGVELDRVVQTVCRHYGVDRSELARRGSRSPARAALAFLARKYTEATLADLVPVLGVSRPESVPNLTRRFSTWLESQTMPVGTSRDSKLNSASVITNKSV